MTINGIVKIIKTTIPNLYPKTTFVFSANQEYEKINIRIFLITLFIELKMVFILPIKWFGIFLKK